MTQFTTRWGRRLAVLAAAMGLAGGAPAHAWVPNADDALLFEMRLNQYRLGDGVRGYATPQGVCVDFADTIMALDIAVRLDKKSRRATGWAFEEGHSLTIDRVSAEEHIMNATRKVAPDDIRDTPEGWCVMTPALSRWLGVTFVADTANALLVVKSDRKLPPQLAAERRARVSSTPQAFDLASLPHSSAPYRGVKLPSIDVVASVGGLSDHRSGGTRIDTQYELYAAGEAGPVAYDVRFASNRQGVPESLRVRAYRTDPSGGLPLGATHIAAGDVQGIATSLVAQSSVGRGFVATNRPVERNDTFDRTNFRGELPRGWDAELYRNGQLMAFANDRADGRYEFLDVPLQYGQNRFEVVLYGPQGQLRREVKSVPVGLDSIPPRKTFWWAGFDDDQHDLIGLSRAPVFRPGGWRGAIGFERGLNAKTSIAATAHTLVDIAGRRRSYGELAVRRALGPALFELSGAQDFGGGTALRAQMLGEFGRNHIGFETIWARGGFTSDRVLKGVTGLHQISIDRFFGGGRTSIPVHLDARYTTRASGSNSLDVTARASASLGRVALTGDITWQAERRLYGPDPPSALETGLLANARIGKVRLRGETRFRLLPHSQFRSATIIGEWSAGGSLLNPHDWRAEIGYDNELGRARAGIGYVRRFNRLAFTASGEAASDGAVAAGLNLAFSLGPDPRARGGFRASAEKLASHGTTLVRVYRDANGNGRRDAGEAMEKGVQVSAGRVPVDAVTDANGEVIVDGLDPFQPVLIGIDGSSLPDPLVQPSTPGMVITPRPGIALALDLPLTSAGDIDGTLARAGGGTVEGVDLELVDAEGHRIATTRSDFDGFFLFESVPYGRYTIRIAQLSADAARLATVLSAVATVDGKTPSVHLGAVVAAGQVRRAGE